MYDLQIRVLIVLIEQNDNKQLLSEFMEKTYTSILVYLIFIL